jgi:alpha-L-rhamnosidase
MRDERAVVGRIARLVAEEHFQRRERTNHPKPPQAMTAPSRSRWQPDASPETTITWEAWDQKYKPNQDWNHAWGALPAYLLPRFVLGAEPLSAGWKQTHIRPRIGTLSFAKGKIPTPRGPITLSWDNKSSFQMSLSLPEGMTAKLDLPASESSKGVSINGKSAASSRIGSRWIVEEEVRGEASIKVDPK